MPRNMVTLDTLERSEFEQDLAKIDAICAAFGDGSDIDWSEQPAIIADSEGVIIDGHHRVAAAIKSGLSTYPALVVPAGSWDRETMTHSTFCKSACDAAEDWVTWGIY